MALMVPCPRCGPRPVEEFLHSELPRVPDSIVEAHARDLDLVFMRDNPAGVTTEAWFHSHGCRRWCYLSRDRITNEWR